MADDYGRDPIAGTLVAATPDRLVIARDSAELGALHIHFPAQATWPCAPTL
uniref:Uncharacterized protein n=1 Tax=Phenylobacterium glaciei TaxID=2803784 RepID=A0A974S921_9CAUL|nr:hypothetical protein JKL49_01810 [Phenylobacterium glaciei]